MKFGIDMGHNCPYDTGTVGLKKEDDLTKEVGTLLIKKLKDAGHTVIDCTPKTAVSLDNSLRQRTDKANENNVNVFVSIHFNSAKSKADGTEVFAISNASKGIAESVLKEILKLGFRNRGVKSGNFFVLKHTAMPAILVECCFCNSPIDMERFNAEQMAEAIKDGLIGEGDEDEPKPDKDYILEITVPTVLKPSTQQASDLPKESVFSIQPGNYSILNYVFEEQHYCVTWTDKSIGDRNKHFVFAEHCKILEKADVAVPTGVK
ncbi:N-acetylmuramoyl-L-alanine amidase [Nostoc sp. CENA543]|uniref:N-acetylmuramoyl-L-alanine amidase n=1 Tax=Nostoc sp. CENA543 TaxID=1869241 RepID=UPI000CA34133|nr:N-acetylmuramoyl-L-alanine amidase [Nostoc sp. CENA543]AUS99955.1 N-acetylmuramoyl-L-alanine amidase [Nostoc sp. CENA543]